MLFLPNDYVNGLIVWIFCNLFVCIFVGSVSLQSHERLLNVSRNGIPNSEIL